MSGVDAPAPWRIAFDNARDPYTARNALGAEKIGGGGGGGGAPDNAEYIVAATDATLTAERVLTNTATITWDFTTPGQAKASTAAGGGNVSNSGTPTLGQYAKWVTATTIQGVNAATVLGDIGAQPLDADLTAIAALTGTNTIYYRSAANTWSPVVVSTGLSFTGGTLTCTVSTAGSQPLDATLTALAAYNTNGLLTQTAADTFTGRTLTGAAAGITVSNGNGVAGDPTLALADDLAALEALTGTNTIYYRSATSTWTAVTFSGLTFTGGVLTASAGGGNVSNSGTPVAGQIAEWVTATTIKGVNAPTPHCGRLAYVGTTQLSFLPANGDKIRISGVNYTIPGTGAGIAGLANTGVRVNNVPGSSLAANTTYWVFAENVAGTVTGHFWTVAGGLAAPHHRPSQTAGNEGVEAWYNGTELPQFTLIGMCRTDASAQFQDAVSTPFVRSWFNRPRQTSSLIVSVSTTSGTVIALGSSTQFLCFAGEAVQYSVAGYWTSATTLTGASAQVYIDGAAAPNNQLSLGTIPAASSWATITTMAQTNALAEGYHYAQLAGSVTGGTGFYSMGVYVVVG